MPVSTVSPEDFVVAWCTSQSLNEVAEATGMNKAAVQARAHGYRKVGINLPKFRRGVTFDRLRIAQLNSLINKYKAKK